MKILLTNDDSHSSPLLTFIIRKLRTLGKLIIVVPKHEQSWKGKSISRFDTLELEKITLDGEPAHTLSGTPADCVNLGVHHLCGGKPDLVVSGINAGINAGMGFLFASGTVGACFEGNIAGIPGVAFSQNFDSETMNRYAAEYALPKETLQRLSDQTLLLLDRVFDKLLADPDFLKHPITWNVNFPFRAVTNCELRIAPVGISTYGSCYELTDLGYVHRLRDVKVDSRPNCDGNVCRLGHVAMTPIDLRLVGQV